MVDIPRFNAQLAQISVPSMHNFQADQNEQIYKAVAGVANTSANIAENLYAADQKYKAEVQGAEDVKKAQESGEQYDLNALPSPRTAAQQAYNQSAINAFAAQYTVDTSLALTNLEDENRDNPFAFLQKAQAYIDGASANIPEHLKPSIVKPLEMNARSIYSSLLKKQIDRNRDAAKTTTILSLDEMIRSALNTEDNSVQDEKIGQIITVATNAAVSGDITAEYAQQKILELRKGIASQRLTNQLLANNNDPKQINSIINMAMSGKTGIKAFDDLSPEERADATKTALGHISYAKGYLGQVAEQAGKYVLNESQLRMYNDLAPKTELTDDVLKEISWGNKSFYNIMKDAQNGIPKIEIPALASDMKYGLENGTINAEDIFKAYDNGYLSGSEAMADLNYLFSPYSLNKQKDSYNIFKSNLDMQMGDITNSIGVVSQTNKKKKYIEDNMKTYLSAAERTDDEIMSFGAALEEQASKRFSKENEYEPVYTPNWFREKTGYNISAIENIIAEASVGGQLDMDKLRELLLDITGNDENQANKLYSMYLAVKNQ